MLQAMDNELNIGSETIVIDGIIADYTRRREELGRSGLSLAEPGQALWEGDAAGGDSQAIGPARCEKGAGGCLPLS